MRFAVLLPLGGGPGREFGLLLPQGGALDLEIAELLGGRLCLIARGDDLGKCGLGLRPIRPARTANSW
jgi:hypothetical protein